MMTEVKVNLGERSYNIIIGVNILHNIADMVKSVCNPSNVFIISNPQIAKHYEAGVVSSLNDVGIKSFTMHIPSGERYKTLNTIKKMYEQMVFAKLDRKSVIIALGGGVVGDMTGFAAATYLRGINYFQIPTSLLAQVDSSIGGKTGVDLPQGKNLVGAFHQPRGVLIDISTLKTLPVRELRSGLAEVIKHGIIYDQQYHNFIKSNSKKLLSKDLKALEEAVVGSVNIKKDVVEKDENESGLRAILNYGHTIGHALETIGKFSKYKHGEASSIGMVTEAILAENIGVAEKCTAREVYSVLSSVNLPVEMDISFSEEEILRIIELDKKTIGGKLKMAIPESIGKCKIVDGLKREDVFDAIKTHKSWNGL
ncbi:MAG: 3-dehydroquinate synthase [Armatimonadota bacterium]